MPKATSPTMMYHKLQPRSMYSARSASKKPLTLHKEIYAELLAHIESVHLPLRCRKCLRHYTKIDDLLDFSKCVNLSQNCSSSSSNSSSIDTNQSCDTDASKITVKKAMATVASNTISTQTSPCTGKDLNDTQQHYQRHLTPISLFNLRWKAKSRLTQEEFISDSVSSIRNLSTDSVNLSLQRRSIGQLTVASAAATATNGKVIRSTSTPLQVCSMFAKPKEAATFNASGGGGGAAHLSSIYHSGYVPDEQNTPAPPDSSQMPQQRAWKVGGRGKMSAVTPLRQVMSKSIQKAFVELATGGSSHPAQAQRLDLSEANAPSDAFGAALDLRLSPVVRRAEQSMASSEAEPAAATEAEIADTAATEPYQILLSAQKLTTESIIITRTQHGASVSNSLPVTASTTNGRTTSTVYNSCESVAIITSSSSNIQQLTNAGAACEMPPITPITSIPGAVITKKLIKFETPQKSIELETGQAGDESLQEDREIFYTPNPGSQPASPSVDNNSSTKDRRRQQIVPRQLSGQFSNNNNGSPKEQRTLGPVKRPLGPRARPPLRACHHQKTFSCVQDVPSDNEYDDEEVFLPNSASTHNDNKKRAASSSNAEPGRLWSLMSSVMRLPATLRTDADKENAPSSTSGSLIRRCASIAGSLVRTMHGQDDDTDVQSMKRKRTQTLDNQYINHLSSSPARSSKRVRIQPRKPIERMRTNY
ncbi:mitosis initiation protein fs(1)Ya [Drosophila nasuta]|uniref:mitosis initiation protein fs(1)Ya n=1 Tax=Drosophila nasuta TaxID=42062 RepID=UPI00295E88BE|nr:mitosis initiation protein fs(1)Ya [Drosophila nasuta]